MCKNPPKRCIFRTFATRKEVAGGFSSKKYEYICTIQKNVVLLRSILENNPIENQKLHSKVWEMFDLKPSKSQKSVI